MRVLICYVIWNKHEMMNWLCSGLYKSFKDKEVDIYFLLDNPIDGTDQMFMDGTMDTILPKSRFNWHFTVHYGHPLEQFKFHLQNIGLKYGYENGYDWIICPQDDQKLEDPLLLQNIRKVYNDGRGPAATPQRIGLIGGRDGFDELDYKNAWGSLFSHPTGIGYKWLKNGDLASVNYLNDGPLCYHRSTIEKVGYHDEKFKVFMSELDYCRRCTKAGLQNYVLGMSVVHEKFGTLRSNLYYQRHEISKHDADYFNKKWS